MDVIMITIREMDRLGIFETKKLYEQALDFSYHARNPGEVDTLWIIFSVFKM